MATFRDLQREWKQRRSRDPRDLFVDKQFPPNEHSLVLDPSGSQMSDLHKSLRKDRVQWRRAPEICMPKQPQMVVSGITLLDLNQGALGNCWYIAGSAHLAMRPDLFKQVVPRDQDFRENYAGIFHFRFWRYGKWVDVIVDDYLPCVDVGRGNFKLYFIQNRREPNEYWAALLEKAYAKLHGCYEALIGGHTQDAMVDISGGVGYDVDITRNPPRDFFQEMIQASERNTLLGCAIFTAKYVEEKRPDGLVALHAYTITKVAEVQDKHGQWVQLIRVRNPWGRQEWNGAWCDTDTARWATIDDATRRSLTCRANDGEFWMAYEDFMKSWENIQMCFVPPLAQDDEDEPDALGSSDLEIEIPEKEWNVYVYPPAEWIRNVTAGGPYGSRSFWRNPQFIVDLKDPDLHDHENKGTMIISLMKIDNRKLEREQGTLYVNFDVFKVDDRKQELLNQDNSRHRAQHVCKGSEKYAYDRELTLKIKLPVGRYYIIPSTYKAGQTAKFILRVFTEAPVESEMVDDTTEPIREPEESKQEMIVKLFQKHAGKDGLLDPFELQRLLNEGFKGEVSDGHSFDLEACRSLLACYDFDRSGFIDLSEGRTMWLELQVWRDSFTQFDKDKSGTIDVGELKHLFRSIGYATSNRVIEAVVKRYGSRQGKIMFSDFILALTRIVTHLKVFPDFTKDGGLKSKAKMTLDEYMFNVLYF